MTQGGEDIMKKVTNGDIGVKGGLKFGILVVMSFLNRSLVRKRTLSHLMIEMCCEYLSVWCI